MSSLPTETTTATRLAQPIRAGVARDYVQLAKPRVASLVLATTAAGFYLGAVGTIEPILLLHVLIATALVATAANALNQLDERDTDARMRRTRNRPLPAGRMTPGDVLRFGVATGVAGMLYAAVSVNLLTSLLLAVTLAGYVFAYTPLKRRTPLSTVVGAVPGALPPLIGWAAARDGLGESAWVLFAILFLWQLPHFLAIAWIYRDDYARAGLPLLTVIDPTGRAAAGQTLLYSAALLPVSLAPTLTGLAGVTYFAAAFVLSGVFLGFGVRMARTLSLASARDLFRYSVIYLPLLLAAMMIDKIVQ
jgi:protoheme IX farnesyltransferase